MLIIADAHVDEAFDNAVDFFGMLGHIARTRQDVVFLGDTFDLWIGLRRYENDLHRRFMRWCREEKNKRFLWFVEGNHEYYVAEKRHTCFSSSSEISCLSDNGKLLFCHGDLINANDRNYLAFRKIMKNRWTRSLVGPFPLGPAITQLAKQRLKTTNLNFKQSIPDEALAHFAETHFRRGVQTIFSGHFHKHRHYIGRSDPRCSLYVIPAWHQDGTIGWYQPAAHTLTCCHWEEIPVENDKQDIVDDPL